MTELFAAPLTNGIRYLLACLLVVSTSVTTEAAGKGTGVARFDPVVQRAVNFLKTKTKVESTGRSTLVAYACLKAGEPVDSKLIVAVLPIVLNKARSGVYKPLNSYEHIYEAGVDAMLLSDLDPVKYRSSIALIANYIQSQQRSDGSWSNGNNPGDISMSQYAVLGLWAAQRADVPIDPSVLDRTALWHMKSFKDGGFPYRPGTTEGPGKGAPTPNVTAGGLGSLAIIRHLFYPDVDKNEKKDTGLFDGVVENVKRKKKIRPSAFPDFSPSIGKATLDGGVRQSLSWTVTRFNPNMAQAHRIYYYYALERAFAMTDTKKVKGAEWYLSCGDALAKLQNEDGSWATHTGPDVGTSFAILFYMRSTSRILGKSYGSGLLQAARGLPDDLSRAFDPMGSAAEKKKKLDPLDDLLAALEKAEFGDTSDKDAEALAKKQQEIVEKIQNGDREELIGQVDRLKGLATHPHPDVRRTALWALGRSGDMMMAPILIKALKDIDVDVMVEARNALCCVSRRANGFGLPSSPLEELEGASPEKRTAAAIAWSDKATQNWQKWWFRVRPYDLRDDLEEAALSSAP